MEMRAPMELRGSGPISGPMGGVMGRFTGDGGIIGLTMVYEVVFREDAAEVFFSFMAESVRDAGPGRFLFPAARTSFF